MNKKLAIKIKLNKELKIERNAGLKTYILLKGSL
jgi:hypothetical protein